MKNNFLKHWGIVFIFLTIIMIGISIMSYVFHQKVKEYQPQESDILTIIDMEQSSKEIFIFTLCASIILLITAITFFILSTKKRKKENEKLQTIINKNVSQKQRKQI